MKTIILNSYDGMYRGSLYVITSDGVWVTPKVEMEELRDLNEYNSDVLFTPDMNKLKSLFLKNNMQIEIGDRFVFIDDGVCRENILIEGEND